MCVRLPARPSRASGEISRFKNRRSCTCLNWSGAGLLKWNAMVTIDDVRALASRLPRSYEAFVRGRVKFRVGRIVYLAFSRDEQVLGFAFPREEREALLQTWPGKFLPPEPADVRLSLIHISEPTRPY